VVSVDGERERNAATVGTTGQLASVPRDLLRLIFTHRVADRATQRDGVPLDGQVQVIRMHPRDRGDDHHVVIGGVNIERHRSRNGSVAGFGPRPERPERIAKRVLAEHLIDGIAQREKFVEERAAKHRLSPPSIMSNNAELTNGGVEPFRTYMIDTHSYRVKSSNRSA